MKNQIRNFLFIFFLTYTGLAVSGGLLGDAINIVLPGVGTKLDEAHDKFKDNVPVYKEAEEGVTNFVKKRINEQCGIPLQILTNSVIAQCSNWSGRNRDRHLISEAIDTLTSTGILRPRDFQGISIRWCPLNGAHGMAPDRNKIYLDIDLKGDAYGTATTLAHEIFHSKQYRRYGSDNFKCKYSIAYTRCGGCQNRSNWLEREAYEFEDSISSRLAAAYNVAPQAVAQAFVSAKSNQIILSNSTQYDLEFVLSSATATPTRLYLRAGDSQEFFGNPSDTWYNIQLDTYNGSFLVYRAEYSLNAGRSYYLGQNHTGNFDVFMQ